MRARMALGALALAGLLAGVSATGATAKVKPVATASPSTGLTNETTLTVSGHGFVPESQLFLVECAKGIKGKNAGSGEAYCDIAHFEMVTATAGGEIPPGTTFTVLTGTIGSNGGECGTSKKTKICYLGVGDTSASKNNSALAKLTFVP